MSTPRLWVMHGLVVRCDELALDARPATVEQQVPDVVVRVGRHGPVLGRDERPRGRVLASYDVGPHTALSVVSIDEGTARHRVQAHFHEVAVATIDPGATTVDLVLAPGVDPALAGVLVSGTLISIVLTLRGHPVLHASSVELDGADGPLAVAFVGRSGMGKSTLATVMCRDGARLLGDDVLRADLMPGGGVIAWPGATATRLREGAHSLGADATDDLDRTADGRTAARLVLAGPEAVPLGALVVPRPVRDATDLDLAPVTGVAAVLTLASFPRILGWTDPATSAQALGHWGDLAQRVPLFTATVPWGPPFAPGLGERLADAVLTRP